MQIQRVQNNNNYNPRFKQLSIPRTNEMKKVLMESSPQCIKELLQAKKVLGCRGETDATKNFHVLLGFQKGFGKTKIKGELRSINDAYFGPFDLVMNNFHYIAEQGCVPLVTEAKPPWIRREHVEWIPSPKKIVIKTDDPMFDREVFVDRYYNKSLTDSGSYIYSIDENSFMDLIDLRYDLPKLTRITKILDMAATKNAKDSIPEIAVNNAQNTQKEQIKKDESIKTLLDQCGFDCYD